MAQQIRPATNQYDLDALRMKLGFWAIFAGFALTAAVVLGESLIWERHMSQAGVASADVVALDWICNRNHRNGNRDVLWGQCRLGGSNAS